MVLPVEIKTLINLPGNWWKFMAKEDMVVGRVEQVISKQHIGSGASKNGRGAGRMGLVLGLMVKTMAFLSFE